MTYEEEALSPDQERTIHRLAALLLTIPSWNENYTVTLDRAKWMVAEAHRVGWTLQVLQLGTVDG